MVLGCEFCSLRLCLLIGCVGVGGFLLFLMCNLFGVAVFVLGFGVVLGFVVCVEVGWAVWVGWGFTFWWIVII